MANLPQFVIPILSMLMAQILSVGINIFSKLAISHAMPASIFVAYRFMFGSVSLIPLVIYKSWITGPKPTWKQACLAFFYGLLGGSLYHNFYLASLTSASATFVSAIINLTPVVTFVIAITLRLETLAYQTSAGKFKILGIMLSIGSVTLLAFCKRVEINFWPTKFNLLPHDNHKTRERNNQVLGLVLAIIATLSNSSFLTIQAKFNEDCDNIFLVPFLLNLMAMIQAVVYALCVEREWDQWKLEWNIRLWATSFAGVFGSGLITTLVTWCISKMGPVFVSTFNPVGLILMTLVGSLVLDEKLYVTSLVAIMFIIVAILLVLWGKLIEANGSTNELEESEGVLDLNEAEVGASNVLDIQVSSCLIEMPLKYGADDRSSS